MLAGELQDPRVSLVEVIKVDISKDLRNAKIFVHHADDAVSRKELLKALQHATPYLRGQLAVRCGLRMVPELYFAYDDSPEKAARIDELLRQIAAERESSPPKAAGESSPAS